MKISKVDHVRAAVAKNKKGIHEGILYKDPSTGGALDLEKRFNDLNKTAMRLYNFFNPVQKGTAPKEVLNKREGETDESFNHRKENYRRKKVNYDRREKWEKKIGKINRAINGFIFEVEDCEAIIKKLNNDANNRLVIKLNDDEINEVTTLFLRNSLRYHEDGVRALLKCMRGDVVSDDMRSQINELVKQAKRDCLKDTGEKEYKSGKVVSQTKDGKAVDFKSLTKRSIQNQNMPVQPLGQGDERIICVSNDPVLGNRKKAEKEGLEAFLSNYADLDRNKRDDMLRRLRRLVDLYFSVPETWDKEATVKLPETVNCDVNFNVWTAHENAKNSSEIFAEIPSDLMQAYKNKIIQDSVKQKQDKQILLAGIRDRNIACYRNSLKVIEDDEQDLFFEDMRINRFWIHHIQNSVERILDNISTEKLYRNNIGYLSEKVWKDALNFLSVKYISIGKAVFNFAMDDLLCKDKRDVELGVLSDRIGSRITSFDYEYIKAGEILQRETAVAVAFAANNLARVTVMIPNNLEQQAEGDQKDFSDFLLWKENDIRFNLKSATKGDTVKAILQFFGGASGWDVEMIEQSYDSDADVMFLYDIKKVIYALRNSSFHFTTANVDKGSWNIELIGKMFAKEAALALSTQKNKFYSNNLPMFYKKEDLRAILDRLYTKYTPRASQVPAFNRVFVRKNFVKELTEMKCSPTLESEDLLKWQNAVYYLFKEIYYNAFLTDPKTKYAIVNLVERMKANAQVALNAENAKDGKDKNKEVIQKKRAEKDFSDRFLEVSKQTLSEICQVLMTECNLQNSKSRKVRTNNSSPLDKDIFQHYKMLLMKVLREAFVEYVKKNYPIILKNDSAVYDPGDAEVFLSDWKSPMYSALIDELKTDAELQKWYVVSRFLGGKMLNQLGGSVRSYVQYITDVKRRAEETMNTLSVSSEEIAGEVTRCNRIVEVIDLCIKLSSKTSHEFSDYFIDEDEYAKYLSKYLDFDDDLKVMAPWVVLGQFCDEGGFDIYRDKGNPILNRNIVLSKLYGADSILENVVQRVAKSDLDKYLNNSDRIEGYRTKGVCTNEQEQKDLLEFQKLKNRIEFRDVMEYSELINDLLGQLINWSYLRERDLMYYQLGFHYICLKNDTLKPEGYDLVMRKDGARVKGTILRQIAGLNINGIGILSPRNDGTFKEVAEEGGSYAAFFKYTDTIMKDKGICPDDDYRKYSLYNAGLELFENEKEHVSVIKVRNTIDHFRYYTGKAGSILDLYSEVFDRFFTYDMKYQKNVLNMLENVLLRYFVILNPTIGTGKKSMDNGTEKDRAQIGIAPHGLTSDEFKYKYEEGELKIEARDKLFLNTVTRILTYPSEIDVDKFAEQKDEIKKSGNTVQFKEGSVYEGCVNKIEGRKVGFKVCDQYEKIVITKDKAAEFKERKKNGEIIEIIVRFKKVNEQGKNEWEFVRTK